MWEQNIFKKGTGRFIYLDSGSIRRGPPQALRSPVLNPSDTCLSFWYYMSGNRTGYLTVSIVPNMLMSMSEFNATEPSDRTMLWNREGQSDDRWYQAEMTIQAEGAFRVLLEGTTKRRHYEIALDDIRLHNSSCEDICTFDDGLCSWVQGQTDDFDWKRQSGPAATNYTGPQSGHSNGKAKVDYYMYINAASASKGGKAVLRHSGFYRPGRACLSFWYHMYGDKMGQLRVDVQKNRESPFPVWSKNGDQGANWTIAAVDLEVGPSVSFEFVGIRGNGVRGDMALDDVSLLTRSCFDCTFDEDVCLWQENEHWNLFADENTGGMYVFLSSVSADCVPYSGRNFSTPVHAMSGPVCVTFMYFLVGSKKNSLQLYMLNQNKELLIWKTTASNIESWNYVSISVEKQLFDFTLVFEMYSYSNCTAEAGIDNIFVKFGKCEEFGTSPVSTVNKWEGLGVSIISESQQLDVTKVSPYQATSSKSAVPEKRKTESRGIQ
ncbi:hypothetical protein ACJMK2_021358 [Sinanodonta woodiana]|uniref:MAM domain-containing protein n=1 Tax=Sinanodonta woodiana TaxID=1069815 RepID=A0ABD3THU7_SINWO